MSSDAEIETPHAPKFWARMRRMPTNKLAAGIVLVAVTTAGAALAFVVTVLPDNFQAVGVSLVGIYLFFTLGWVGIVTIVRREFYQVWPQPIRGRWAVLYGLLISGAAWTVAAWGVWQLVKLIVQ